MTASLNLFSPLFLALNPVADRLDAAANSPFLSGPHARSFILLVLLCLTVAAAFAWLYIAEWRLQRGFRRYKLSDGAVDEPFAIEPLGPRPNLVHAKRNGSAHEEPEPEPVSLTIAPAASPIRGTSQAVWFPQVDPQAATLLDPAQLAPPLARPVGVLNIVSDHKLSDIFVDGSFVGNPPAKLCLPPGPHTVQIRTPGLPEVKREITVISGAELRLVAAAPDKNN